VLGGGGGAYAARLAGRLTVRLGTVGGLPGLWRYIAMRADALFGSHGYNVTFQTYPTEAALRAAYLAGQLDAIDTLVPTVALLREAGSDARFFLATGWLHQSYPFVARAANPARGLNNLGSQPIASYPLDDPVMGYWLGLAPAALGIDLRRLNLVPSQRPDLALLYGDAASACFATNQWELLAGDPTFRRLADLQTAWSALSGATRPLVLRGYVASAAFLARHADFARDFVASHRAALRVYQQDRNAFLNVVANFPDGPTLGPSLSQIQATALGYDGVAPDRVTIGAADLGDYRRLLPLMVQAGFLRTLPDVATLFQTIAV